MLPTPRFSATRLLQDLTEWARRVVMDHNSLAEGRIEAVYSATAAPTTGSHQRGDYIRNSAPSELGTVLTKYVIVGWVCTVAGTPGTWVECRSLTGN